MFHLHLTKPCVYVGHIAFFHPSDDSPCKAVVFKGEPMFATSPSRIVSFVLQANGDTDAMHQLFTEIQAATPNDPRHVKGVQSIHFYRLSEEQIMAASQGH